MKSKQRLKILIIRRDNIGDLVCTTPLFSALRRHFPGAEICALVNSYNAAVLENNPHIDEVYAYTKAKHRPPGKSIVRVYAERAALFLKLRYKCFDYALLATSPASVPRTLKLARIVRPRHIIAFQTGNTAVDQFIDLPVVAPAAEELHETEIMFKLLTPFHINRAPSSLQIFPLPQARDNAQHILRPKPNERLIGIHISARKPSQRWPTEYFIELVKTLAKRGSMSFALFWSPGEQTNPLHPGDDKKASEILASLGNQPIMAFPTHHLSELIAGLSLCDAVICSDGGAMHIAAGLGKPILCFFGQSSATRWHPWGVPYTLIQPSSQMVADVGVTEVAEKFIRLLG
jgi:ADP-heptose:LPS heptosyltransferase